MVAALTLAAVRAQEPPAAVVLKVEGQVALLRGAEGPATAAVGTRLLLGDSLRPDEGASAVLVTRTGSKYHRAGCRYLSKSKTPIALEKAKSRYSPCGTCKPPS